LVFFFKITVKPYKFKAVWMGKYGFSNLPVTDVRNSKNVDTVCGTCMGCCLVKV
jgi:hypothetical protein